MNLDDPAQRRDVEQRIGAALQAAVTIDRWWRLSGGAIQHNVALDVSQDGVARQWVLRTDAPTAVRASRTRREEFALLRAAAAAGVVVPRPLVLCPAEHGRPEFFVMDRVEGVAAGHRLTKPGALPDAARLAHALGRNLARIHALRPPQPALSFLGEPPASPTRALLLEYRDYLDHWHARFGGTYPALEWGLQWWLERVPDREPVTLVHRDYRTGNYLVRDGTLAATLDWEFAGWGNPLEDLGWFFAPCWRFAGPGNVAGGIADAQSFLDGYNDTAGTRYTEVDTHEWQALAQLRWAIIALQQCERHLAGGERSLELALTGRLLPALERDLLALTPA
jgi:aminoglycoside phosphotransferase (APT) family kinase protein